MRGLILSPAATTPGGDVARVVEPGFRQGRRRARSVIKCQRSAGPVYNDSNAQAFKRQGSSTQAAGAQAPRDSRAQGRRRASRGSQAPGPWPLDKVSGSAARGSRLR